MGDSSWISSGSGMDGNWTAFMVLRPSSIALHRRWPPSMSEPSAFRMIGYFRDAVLIFLQCRAISLSVGFFCPNQKSSSNSLIDDISISNGGRSLDSLQSFSVYHTSRLPSRIVLCFCGTKPPFDFRPYSDCIGFLYVQPLQGVLLFVHHPR